MSAHLNEKTHKLTIQKLLNLAQTAFFAFSFVFLMD